MLVFDALERTELQVDEVLVTNLARSRINNNEGNIGDGFARVLQIVHEARNVTAIILREDHLQRPHIPAPHSVEGVKVNVGNDKWRVARPVEEDVDHLDAIFFLVEEAALTLTRRNLLHDVISVQYVPHCLEQALRANYAAQALLGVAHLLDLDFVWPLKADRLLEAAHRLTVARNSHQRWQLVMALRTQLQQTFLHEIHELAAEVGIILTEPLR